MLTLIAGTPDDYDLQLRVLLGKQALCFTFSGVEVLPAFFTRAQADLAGSTTTLEADAHQSVEEHSASVEEHLPSVSDNEDADSLDSDEPIDTQRAQRRKNLCHPTVRNDSYDETGAEDSSTSTTPSQKRRRLRRNRPAKGAYVLPPADGSDLWFFEDFSDFEEVQFQPARARRGLEDPLGPQKRSSLRKKRAAQKVASHSEVRNANQPLALQAPKILDEPQIQQADYSRSIRAPKIPTKSTPSMTQITFDSYKFSTTKPNPASQPVPPRQPNSPTHPTLSRWPARLRQPDSPRQANPPPQRNTTDLQDTYIGVTSTSNNLPAMLAQITPTSMAQEIRRKGKCSRSPKPTPEPKLSRSQSRSRSPLPDCAAQ